MFATRRLPIAALCFAATFTTCFAQSPTPNTDNIALVYVTYRPTNSSTTAIMEYSADAAGKLTELPGSPYTGHVGSLTANGEYVFGNNNMSGLYFETYKIQSDGTLRWVAESQYTKLPPSDYCQEPVALFLDHTGATLYNAEDYEDAGCSNNGYQSYAVQKSSGKLAYINNSSGWLTDGPVDALSFTGNNEFAYGSNCYHFSPYLYSFRRNSNGSLTAVGNYATGSGYTQPTPPASGDYYCLNSSATDPANHVAIAVQPYNDSVSPVGPYQIATFTANSSGYLNTTSTYSNMPTVAVGNVQILSMSPSGTLLAVGGDAGLQVFHFNGASPATADTGLMATASINRIFWDNSNHLYAISTSASKLYVYTVTSTSATAAPGSPYSIPTPYDIAVVPTATGTSGCAAPASDGVNICSPASGSSVSSPVQVTATAKVTGTLSSVQLWIDGVKKYSTRSSTLNTSVSLSAGSHRFAVLATNAAGQKWENAINADVQ
jgi:hypothetical protein